MIEIVGIAEFNSPIYLIPGDKITVTHKFLVDGKVVEAKRLVVKIDDTGTWTHSILFKLNGNLNHIMGDHNTVTWIKEQV